jgi:hypothetical protein
MSSRRDFLQKLAASGLTLPLLPSIHAKDDTWVQRYNNYQGPVLRVAIMGLGSYGTRVAEAMQSSTMAKLTGVISGTPSKVKEWQC